MNRRDTNRYKLTRKGKVLQYGITDNPERRKQEHREDGKQFARMELVGPKVTRETAERWEEERLASFRKSHRGRNPRYNKTDK